MGESHFYPVVGKNLSVGNWGQDVNKRGNLKKKKKWPPWGSGGAIPWASKIWSQTVAEASFKFRQFRKGLPFGGRGVPQRFWNHTEVTGRGAGLQGNHNLTPPEVGAEWWGVPRSQNEGKSGESSSRAFTQKWAPGEGRGNIPQTLRKVPSPGLVVQKTLSTKTTADRDPTGQWPTLCSAMPSNREVFANLKTGFLR